MLLIFCLRIYPMMATTVEHRREVASLIDAGGKMLNSPAAKYSSFCHQVVRAKAILLLDSMASNAGCGPLVSNTISALFGSIPILCDDFI